MTDNRLSWVTKKQIIGNVFVMDINPDSSDASQEPNPEASALVALTVRLRESQSAVHELAKDTKQVTQQARTLRQRAAILRDAAKRARDDVLTPPSLEILCTVPEACQTLGVAERTLRRVLREPELAPRVRHQNRKVGTFYKFVMFLPPSLMADLSLRFRKNKIP